MDKEVKDVVDFYQEATRDYEFWSKSFNMHFGLADWNVLNREKMLRKMNDLVLTNLTNNQNGSYLDTGCGCGATLTQGCEKYKESTFTGVTISPWQINKGTEILASKSLTNGELIEADYHHLPFDDNSFNGAYALESFCHSNDPEKLMGEWNRVIKQNGRLVITDGFIKVKPENSSKYFNWCYRMLCNGFALPKVPNIYETINLLGKHGFKVKEVNDLSWKIAPCVFHSNFVIIKYLLYTLFSKNKLKKENINNLKGSFVSLLIGLQRGKFSYYQIIAKK